MTGSIPAGVRIAPLAPDDVAAARALAGEGRAGELLQRALAGTTECVALAATRGTTRGRLAGIALYGEVAGAAGTAALHWIGVAAPARRGGIARALVAAVVAALDARGARLVVAEVPSGREHEPVMALLRRSGFVREGAVADYFRDGVALTLWVRRRS